MFRFMSVKRLPMMASPVTLMTRNISFSMRAFSRTWPKNVFSKTTFRNFLTQPPKKPGLKELMKEYGYSALGIYLGLSAIDLPLCYLLVHSMGKDEIEYYENKAKQQFGYGLSDEELAKKQEIIKIEEMQNEKDVVPDENQSMFSYVLAQFSWTEFAIAYGIHKSLIFIRVPICAAITPGVVKALRRWGFKIGSDKLGTTAAVAKDAINNVTANSARFGTRPDGKKRWFSWFF